jgi:hypothetical protein
LHHVLAAAAKSHALWGMNNFEAIVFAIVVAGIIVWISSAITGR